MEVCFKGSLKNLYNIFAAAGSLPKEARRCWYVAKPICDGLPTTLSAAYVSKGIDAWGSSTHYKDGLKFSRWCSRSTKQGGTPASA
jgi:hypothetical protein